MHSHHSHSGQYCKHATGTLEQVVLEAISQGFQVFGLSEHAPRYRIQDLYPEEEGLTTEDLTVQFNHFLDEAHRLKKLHAPKISLLVGLETEYITSLDLDALETLLKDKRIEYLVGSIHHVNEIPIDFDLPTYQKSVDHAQSDTEHAAQETFLCRYFDAQLTLLERFRPEIVGHFDICRLYKPHLQLSDFPSAWKKMERNILHVVQYGGLFELNAAAFRKGWDTAYPAKDVLKVIMTHGGRLALSDDSHGPHAVGLNYLRLAEYLERNDVSELWYLRASNTSNAAGRGVEAVKFDGHWRDHAFWVR